MKNVGTKIYQHDDAPRHNAKSDMAYLTGKMARYLDKLFGTVSGPQFYQD